MWSNSMVENIPKGIEYSRWWVFPRGLEMLSSDWVGVLG